MENDKIKKLVHIVASRAGKDIENVKKSGQNWLKYFLDNNLIKENYQVLDNICTFRMLKT
jgi:hypothetical protein